jgi:orotate phosphoribosyltransferase
MIIKTLSRDELAEKISGAARITGEFTLRSGATSTVYFDKYRFESDPEILSEIAKHMADLVPDGTTRLVGLEMGGIPLATALSMVTGIKSGFCRKQAKKYGTCLRVEGGVEEGERITIIEDVITSGGAAIDSIYALREQGVKILALLSVVDREAGAEEEFEKLGVKYIPLFKRSELDKFSK